MHHARPRVSRPAAPPSRVSKGQLRPLLRCPRAALAEIHGWREVQHLISSDARAFNRAPCLRRPPACMSYAPAERCR
eukprot:100983-Alexandrium_andersonii.AAC.1